MNGKPHTVIRCGLGATLFALVWLSFLSSPLLAQQDARQLNRDQAQTTRGGSERRIALVIGNGAYTNAPPLKNPPNDAQDMATVLKALGFEVTSGINLSQRDLKRLIREFGQSLRAGGSGLFYYAGHGVQSKGKNYLVPVEADIQSEAEVEDVGVDVNFVLGYMEDAQNGLNIVILDACRNNPFARSFRSAGNGLAQVDAPTGTLIAYATAPGRVASDGGGRNGLYTAELLNQMQVPGRSVTEMLMHVRAAVMKETGNKQVPWEASSLVGAFYFSGPQGSGAVATAPVTERKVDPTAFELSYWETIKGSTDPLDFKSYLEKYPDGQFADLARRRAAPPATTKPNPLAGVTEAGGESSQILPRANSNITPETIESKYQRGLLDEVVGDAKAFLSRQPDNAKVNVVLGFALLRKLQESEGFTYLDRGFLGGEPITSNVRRHRLVGPLLQDGSIEINVNGLAMRYGDETYSAQFSEITNFGALTFGQSGSGVYIKGKFQNAKGKTETKEFKLFAPSATIVQVPVPNTFNTMPIVYCQNCEGWSVDVARLFDHLRNVRR